MYVKSPTTLTHAHTHIHIHTTNTPRAGLRARRTFPCANSEERLDEREREREKEREREREKEGTEAFVMSIQLLRERFVRLCGFVR